MMKAYTRSTEYTTAAAGLIAIIQHRNELFPLTIDQELAAWHASVNLPTRSSNILGLALFAKQQGLHPTVLVESLEYDYPDYRFHRFKKSDIELAQQMHEMHLTQARKAGIEISEQEITFTQVEEFIQQRKILLIRLNEGIFRGVGSTSKYVVIYGKKNNHYLVLDPVQEKPLLTVKPEQLKESFETLTTKKKREHRLLVF